MNVKKEITIYDIAKKLDVSSATVSRALNDHPAINKNTRKLVQQAAKELGYRQNNFASNLRKQKSNTIGIIVHEMKTPFITMVLAGIEKVTTDAGYDLLIAHSSESMKKEMSNAANLFHKRVDGIIASLAFDTDSLDHFKPFVEKNIPVIFFDRVEEDLNYTKVIIDNYRCGYKATRHLIEQGCQRIAMVTSNLNRNVYQQRYRGYMDALSSAGLKANDQLVFVKDLTEQSGLEVAQVIRQLPEKPDGVFITNDFTASVIMKHLKDFGFKIPQDIAIVGFNNDPISKLVEPELTTIDYPGMDMGEIAATSIINHLKGKASLEKMNTILIHAELIIRASSQRCSTSLI